MVKYNNSTKTGTYKYTMTKPDVYKTSHDIIGISSNIMVSMDMYQTRHDITGISSNTMVGMDKDFCFHIDC